MRLSTPAKVKRGADNTSRNSFVNQNEAPLLRFVLRVLVPVGQVFTVDPRSIHIFHDLTGPLSKPVPSLQSIRC